MQESGVIDPHDYKEPKCASIYGQKAEPPGALPGLTGLTVAEYFHDEERQDVLRAAWSLNNVWIRILSSLPKYTAEVYYRAMHRACAIAALSFFLGTLMLVPAAPPDDSVTWRFDRLDQIGGYPTTLLGHPRVIETPAGKAVQFNGADDAIYVDVHPLAGAGNFTWEVIFRPDPGGAAEQRFFHLQERDPKTGTDTNTRMLFEIRVIGDQWALDSFAMSGAESLALLDLTKLHALGVWHAAAAVYDGHEFRNYVDGLLEGSGPLHLTPQGAGHTSIGTRINRVNYFKGAVLEARMTRRVLAPSEFLRARN
jgi:hypothetical protein